MHKSVLSLVCCLFFFLSCQEEIETMPNGSLNIVLTDEAAVTRTLPEALSDELRQQFTIELLRDREGTIVPEYKGALKDFGDQRVFKVGSYQLKAYLGENPSLALDAPYYYGEVQDIAIEKGKATTVTVGCKVANALATFEIVNQEVFDKRLKDYYVEVSAGGESVTWKPGDATHPYFKAGGRVTMALIGTSVETGQEGSYALNPIETVKAGVKYNYKLSMKASNVSLEVTTETQQEPITINETVPDSWLPKAKVFSEDFDENHVLTYTETADALSRAGIAYTALRPVQDVEFAFNFADKHLEHLNKTYLLSELSEEDRRALAAVNIVLPDLTAGSTEGVIDFAGVTSGMLTHDGGQDTDNIIAVRVKANDRWSDAGMYTIRTVKPVFKVGYYPGNVWTKEFTLNTLTADSVKTGNLDKFTDIAYEFSADGNSWEAMPGDLRKAGLSPGTSYYVRAKYRGEVPGEKVEVKTYPQTPLENGNLAVYSIVRGEDGKASGSYGAQYEWSGWTTLNVMTAGECAITAYAYNSRSGTRPTEDVPEGAETGDKSAVWIMTIGYGYGGTNNKPKNITQSELKKDISYSSHPTGVRFWYKYAPYKGDKTDIKVEIYNGETLIGDGQLQTDEVISSYQPYLLNINYLNEYIDLKPDKLVLLFKSGFNTEVEKRESFSGSWWQPELTNSNMANPMFRGSELFIDDVELIYDK
jgi:hypothetical protein